MERHRFANISTALRGRIVGLHECGLSKREIAEKINVHYTTVERWISKFTAPGMDGLQDHRKNNKRSRKISSQQNLDLARVVREHPWDAAADNLGRTNLNISVRTCHRRLKEEGLHASEPAFKPALTPNHLQQRLQYVNDRQQWTIDDWRRVIWSDEKLFTSSKDGRRIVYRGRNQRLDLQVIAENRQSTQKSVIFWGCMTGKGLMKLHQVSARMNAEEYIEILENIMLPAAREVFPEEDHPFIYFQQDNASIHTAIIVREWFVRNPEVILIPHPPCSPDLNPIENIWGLMARRWRLNQEKNSRQNTIMQAMDIWESLKLRPDFTENIVQSMHRRLRMVRDNGDHWIKF